MKIAYDLTGMALEFPTGKDLFGLGMLKALLALDMPHEYLVFCRKEGAPDMITLNPAVKVYHWPRVFDALPSGRMLWMQLYWPRLLHQAGADVVFVPTYTSSLTLSVLHVATILDLTYFRLGVHLSRERMVRGMLLRLTARRCDAIVVISEATRRDVCELLNVHPDKVQVVYPGIEDTWQREIDADRIAQVRDKYGLPLNYLLCVGTLEPRKNHVRIIEGFARAYRSGALPPDSCLAIVGKRGWMYHRILAAPARLGVQDRVVFVGYADRDDLPALYSGALMSLYISLYEGFGIPALEALRCGVPLIASNVSSLPEVTGDAAVLVDPCDVEAIAVAIGQLAADPTMRAELSRRGLAQSAHFTWRAAAEQLLSILERVK